MTVRELKALLENLSDEMLVASISKNGTLNDAKAYVDEASEEEYHLSPWLVITAEEWTEQ